MRKMGIGLGVGINRSNYAQGIFNAYSARVVADGGVVESGTCVDAVSSLLQSASLLLIPSGYKGGKLYAEIPTNGNGDLTWTRGSDAFRTNASGVIQRVPWNLLSYSEQFDNAAWIKSNATITSNAINAPNGTLTADKLIETTANGVHNAVFVLSPNVTTYTASFYAKAAERNFVYYSFGGPSWGGQGFMVNLTTGAVSQNTTGTTPTVTLLPDGWVKIEASRAAVSTTQIQFQIFTGLDATTFSYTGDSTKGIYIWGAQLVEGTTAQTYLPTTDRLNFPRLSYMYGSCPSVLLEPQRTNLALWSEDITNTGGWTLNNVTATANTTTAPNGTTTADTLTATASTASHNIVTVSRLPATYTGSIYAKKGTHNFLQIWDGASQNAFANFDLNTGVLGTIGTLVTATITSVGNGWYRCSITFTPSGGGAFRYAMVSSSSAAHNESWTANGTETIYLWGGQTEVGAYPTTYIPTTSATATRVADSFSRSNIYTNGLISASGGTWFVELRNNVAYPRVSGYPTLFISSNTAGSSTLTFGFGSSNSASRFYLYSWISGTFTNIGFTSTDNIKVAFAFTTTTLKVFVNGSVFASYTGLTIDPTTIQFLMGIAEVPTFIQQMALFPTPLSDTQCQTLTT